jgi:hypothetical protein
VRTLRAAPYSARMENALELITGMPDPARVRELEALLYQAPQVDLQTAHLFAGGMYARTILIPAGTMLTGALTELDNVCVVCGDITVTTDEGAKRLTGYHVLGAAKGSKRAGLAHADTWWTTLIRTDATTVEDAENEMTAEAGNLQTRRAGIDYLRADALEGVA